MSGTYWGNVSANGTASLNSIPRTSSFSLNTSSGTFGSTQFVITINRASSSFTHKVYYQIQNSTHNAWLVNGDGAVGTSISFTPSTSDSNYLANSTSGTAVIKVDTYNGGTWIGTASKTITVNVPDSVKPTITSLNTAIVDAGASTSYGYVKGKSKCKLTINGATGSYGSTISSYHISGGGFSSSSSSFTTGVLNSSGNITFSAYVMDSRGRKSDTKTVTINVQDYSIPVISYPTAYRCNSEGTPDDNGTYIKAKFEYTHSSNISGNTATTKIEYKKATETTWTNAGTMSSSRGITIGNGGISTASTYNVRYTVSDMFITVTKSLDVAPSFVTMDFRKGGKGIAIGKASETDNLFEVGMDTKLNKVFMSKGNIDPQTGRTQNLGDLYTYNTVSTNTGQPTNYTSVLGFGRGTSGTVEICGEWTAGRGLWYRALRDTENNWFDWKKVVAHGDTSVRLGEDSYFSANPSNTTRCLTVEKTGTNTNYPALLVKSRTDNSWGTTMEVRTEGGSGGDRPTILFTSDKTDRRYTIGMGLSNNDSFTVNYNHGVYDGGWGTNLFKLTPDRGMDLTQGWYRIHGNGGIHWENYGGGWNMTDSTWMRSYGGKNVYTGNGTIYTEGTMKCHILDDNVGSSNCCYVDNANGSNSQITLRPDTDNRGNLGHRNYTWNYANITSIGNTFSLDRETTYNVSEYVDNDSMYDMVKNMSFYLEQEKSVEEFQEEVELKQTEEYKNADEETQSQMLKAIEKSIPSTYYYSKRSKLVANAEELPFEVAPHSHVADGSRTIETGSFMVGLASALQKAIQKIEDLESKIEELKMEKGE